MPLGGHVGGAGEIKGGPGLVGHAWGAWGCAGGLCCRNRGRGDWGYCHCDRLWGACWRSSSIMQGGELGARHGRLGTLLVLLVLLWLWLGGGKELLCDAGLAARTVIGGAGHGCCGSRRQSLVTLPAAVRVHISAAILFLPTASCWYTLVFMHRGLHAQGRLAAESAVPARSAIYTGAPVHIWALCRCGTYCWLMYSSRP